MELNALEVNELVDDGTGFVDIELLRRSIGGLSWGRWWRQRRAEVDPD